jgi:hypothetical protein
MAALNFPKKVVLGDITVRDGYQHEEKFIPTDAKIWVAEQLILAGFKRIEVTNFGNPRGMPQFKDADEVLKGLHNSKRVGQMLKDVEITTITIREKAVERAIAVKKNGYGPDGTQEGRGIHPAVARHRGRRHRARRPRRIGSPEPCLRLLFHDSRRHPGHQQARGAFPRDKRVGAC